MIKTVKQAICYFYEVISLFAHFHKKVFIHFPTFVYFNSHSFHVFRMFSVLRFLIAFLIFSFIEANFLLEI